jgi:hypothetical protein
MAVTDLPKKVCLLFLQEYRGCDAVNWRVTPSLPQHLVSRYQVDDRLRPTS